MIDFQNVYKSFGDTDLLRDINIRINSNEHVGLIGPNGCGKSTVFKLITQELSPDKGNINIPKDSGIGYLEQCLDNRNIESKLLDFVEASREDLSQIQNDLKNIEQEIDNNPNSLQKHKNLETLGELQSKFEYLGGYEQRTKSKIALSGLGFSEEDFSAPLNNFSGGWQMRAALAKVLVSNSNILLLDEPSNYLDLPAIEWLKSFLKSYEGTLLLISHDRNLLNALTNITLELNNGIITKYPGDYDYYSRIKKEREKQLEQEKENQEKKKEHIENFIEKFRYKASKASLVQSRIKMLEKMKSVELPKKMEYTGSLILPEPPKCGNDIINLNDCYFKYNESENWMFENLDLSIIKKQRVAVIGYNGIGKTTLLKILCGILKPQYGKRSLGHNVKVGYQAQEFGEILNMENTVYDTLKESAREDINNREVLGAFGFSGDDIYKRCQFLSGGEKIKLLFARIFSNPPNFLILDEPTTHLDIKARENLQSKLKNYTGAVCFVSHDIEFVKNVANQIIAITPYGLKRFHGGYDYYLEKIKEFDTLNNCSESNSGKSENKKKNERRERRQQRAKVIEEFNKKKNKIENDIYNLEQEIVNLESEKEELTNKVSNSSNTGNIDYEQLNKRLKEVNELVDTKTTSWDSLSCELEKLEKEYNNNLKKFD